MGSLDFDVGIFTIFSLKFQIKFAIKQKAEFTLTLEHRLFEESKIIGLLWIYFRIRYGCVMRIFLYFAFGVIPGDRVLSFNLKVLTHLANNFLKFG